MSVKGDKLNRVQLLSDVLPDVRIKARAMTTCSQLIVSRVNFLIHSECLTAHHLCCDLHAHRWWLLCPQHPLSFPRSSSQIPFLFFVISSIVWRISWCSFLMLRSKKVQGMCAYIMQAWHTCLYGIMSHVHYYITHTWLALIYMRHNDFIMSKIPLSLGLKKCDDVMLFVPFV